MLVVSERAREMALRLAIGAAPRQVIRLVMTGAGQLLLGGIALGIALTVAAERALRGALFGVSPNDPVAIATAAATLLVVSALAAAVPAIRVSRVAPSGVLKEE